MIELLATVSLLLAYAGLGPDALQIPDRVLARAGSAAPRAALPLARELLAQPLAATDAAALFERSVPPALRRLAVAAPPAAPAPIREALDEYIAALASAHAALLAATSRAALDETALARELLEGLPSLERLHAVEAAVDAAALEQANAQFLDATARFVSRARTAVFPQHAVRFDSAIGVVSIGSRGSDRHGPDAALIVDPGGDDVYERAPLAGGISVIVDLAGDDLYTGADLAVRGFSAIVDLAGNDRYEMSGPGLGAAAAGASLVLDAAGDDRYSAGHFALGAALFGVGAVIDLGGNDRYRLQVGGQGFALAGGLGLLWDREGDDVYQAAGLPDGHGRGGALSFAQGAASGLRRDSGGGIGGGIGILRDERGNDRYEAEMFAQGMGYYYSVGLLWDESGDDHYTAVRYAQGAGVHQAVGVLRDDAGNDRYEASVGVGQGMGLDLALGVLLDAAGDDRYRAGDVAQGSATLNGIGLLFDRGGRDRFEVDERRAWGQADWYCGLPSVGIFSAAGVAEFVRAGQAVQPLASMPQVHELPAGDATCGARERAAQPEPGAAPPSYLPR